LPVETDNIVPARVRAAMEYLGFLSLKTMEHVVSNDVGFHVVDGQELTDREKDTQIAACGVIEDYFNGSLKLNEWENFQAGKAGRRVAKGAGTPIRCPLCAPNGNEKCILCKGSGILMVFPAVEE